MEIKNIVNIKGTQTVKFFDTSKSKWGQAIEFLIEKTIKAKAVLPAKLHRAAYVALTRELEKFKTREMTVHNIVVTAGRSVLAQRLAGTTTYTGTINNGALGSSSTAVSNSDTQLGTEVYRTTVASSSYTTNSAFIDFFYTKASTNGTYQEFGTFIDGSGVGMPNTGQMFTHVLTGGWTKSNTESMTVSCTYVIS